MAHNGKFKLLRKGHKQVGIFLALFLILVSVTGILLNHTQTLHLSQRAVPAVIAARYYDDASSQSILGFKPADQYYFTLGGSLFLDQTELALCDQIQGVAIFSQQIAVLCSGELLMFTQDHRLIERISGAHGLPENINAIHAEADVLMLSTGAGSFRFNIDSLQISASQNSPLKVQLPVNVPFEKMLGQSVSWQQFILDLHSGAFLGNAGKLMGDLVALLLIAMAISGLVMWRNPR